MKGEGILQNGGRELGLGERKRTGSNEESWGQGNREHSPGGKGCSLNSVVTMATSVLSAPTSVIRTMTPLDERVCGEL